MNKEERITALKAEFEEYVNNYTFQHDPSFIFREWMFGKLAELQEANSLSDKRHLDAALRDWRRFGD